MHAVVLRHIESLGFATSVHRMCEYCELHAVTVPAGEPVYLVRVDGDSDDDVFLAACEMAAMCGSEE
jgi:hypothetical protein